MSLLDRAFAVCERLLPAEVVHAHCDIPCGIYDPHLAQIAALTVIRMNQLINDLPASPASATDRAKLGRYIATKDEHAEVCKREVRILWGDYFRPEHVEQHPELHGLVFNAMKLGSKARQEVNVEATQELLATVQQIAEIFWSTKGAGTVRQPSRQTAGGELVYPA